MLRHLRSGLAVTKEFSRRAWLLGVIALASVTNLPAHAQSDICNQYRAELANLDRGGGRNYAALAEQQRVELNRMIRYYNSLSCESGRRLFGPPPSPECQAAGERIRAMEINFQRLAAQASESREERRRALLAAINRNCGVAPRQRGLFDSLFGGGDPVPDPREVPRTFDEPRSAGAGSGRPVCVRTCDGSFFPLMTTGGGNTRAADQLCQALCPAVETRLFFLPGHSELERAFSVDGTPYMSLANAFRFRTTFDPSCACRPPGQSWEEALRQADVMLPPGRNDIVVTPETAREMSRPRGGGAGPASGARQSIPVIIPDDTRNPSRAPAQTGGITPPTEQARSGSVRPPSDDDRRTVRIIAPTTSTSRNAM